MRLTRYSTQVPKLGPVTFMGPFVIVLAAPLTILSADFSLFFIKLGLIIIAIEFIIKLTGMNFMMLTRKIRSVFLNILGGSLLSTPRKWERNHLSILLIICGFGMPISDTSAALRINDSLKFDRDWSIGMIGLRKEDIVDVNCKSCPISFAITQLIPDVYSVLVSSDISDKTVSYSKVQEWGKTLQELATENGLKIEIVKRNLNVLVTKSNKVVGVSFINDAINTRHAIDKSNYEMIVGDTVEATFRRWLNSENMNLIYSDDLEKIEVTVSGVFHGNVLEAIDQAITAFQYRGKLPRAEKVYSPVNKTLLLKKGDKK
jgi:hypothetical protein